MSRGTRGPRGGLGVRKAAAEKLERSTKYQLTGVRPGSLVVEALHRVKLHTGATRSGILTRNSGTAVYVLWAGDEEATYYPGGDARYKVDTDQWRIGEVQVAALRALTRKQNAPRVMPSPQNEAANQTEESYLMSTEMPQTREELKKLTLPVLRKFAHERGIPEKQKKDDLIDSLLDWVADNDEVEDDDIELDDEVDDTPAPAQDDELDDDELDDEEDPALAAELEALDDTEQDDDEEEEELDDEAPAEKPKKATPPEPSGDTLTAKQVATRIGTDAKVLRKFFRSPASTVEAVGQGGRYEFAKEDLDKIKSEFETWQSGNKARGTKRAAGKSNAKPERAKVEDIVEVDDELELDDEEPTSEELDDLELELDDELED